MEPLRRRRTQLRREFTLSVDKLEACREEERKVCYITVITVAKRLFKLEDELREEWSQLEEFDEEKYRVDQDKAFTYQEQYNYVKSKYEEETMAIGNRACAEGETTRCKLPKLEITKFDGSIKNWLLFWGQFGKVDKDPKLKDIDKFQYLLQSISPESPASQLILAYPPSDENYKKAVQALKERFGREDLLIETYVRGLLQLIIRQQKGDKLSLPQLYDKLQAHLQALEMLGVTKDKFASIMYPMIESALPEDVLRSWNRSTKESTDLSSLVKFLKQEVESEERIALAKEGFGAGRQEVIPTACFMVKKTTENEAKCIWCKKENHSSTECLKASKMTMEEKVEYVKKESCCLICLKPRHTAKRCKSYPKCLICARRHVTIMCQDVYKNSQDGYKNEKPKEGKKTVGDRSGSSVENLICDKKSSTTILQTVCVTIAQAGKKKVVRAIIDSGAQRSYIKKKAVGELGMTAWKKERVTHCLFGERETAVQECDLFAVEVQSLGRNFSVKMNLLGQESICGSLPKVKSASILKKLSKQGIALTETHDSPDEICILIGADYYGSLLTGDIRQLDNGLTAINTLLGWTIQGPLTGVYSSMVGMITTLHCFNKIELEDLWSLESLGIMDPGQQSSKATREMEMLQSFNNTIKINEAGRYEVELPWRENMPRPCGNYEAAKRRLSATTARLEVLGKTNQYDEVFKEWLEQGIVEEVPNQAAINGFFLPHHPIIKETSLTFKIRPVFDASSKGKDGVSLNACVEKGPSLIELIPNILTGFRKEAIGITADIARAFLQVSVSPQDREYLKFLWWTDVNNPKRSRVIYRHNRVVFGVASSPFHLAATIKYHLNESPEHLRKTAEQLGKSFYVDNCVTSARSAEDMQRFMTEAREIMNNGKFNLRCWVTAPEQVEKQTSPVSVLGLLWNTETDTLSCNVNNLPTNVIGKVTKRGLLSIAQKIFDPIGIFCPTSIIPKIIMQKCWKLKLAWDHALPTDLQKEYECWAQTLHLLGDISIPRRLTEHDIAECHKSLHIFADASKLAYATCIFLRSEYRGKVCVRLVMAKSRVTPAKEITMPRLELIAATLATRLSMTVIKALDLVDCKKYYWTDSSVVLSWIKGDGEWTVFVKNRVSEIRNLTSTDDWRHIPGHLNPADMPSRGVSCKSLLESGWWGGPAWLKEESWPSTDFAIESDLPEVVAERKPATVQVTLCQQNSVLDSLTYFSDYSKTIRMVAWMLRMKGKRKARMKELAYEEVEYAEKKVIKLIQEKCKDKIDRLQHFGDKEGLLRLHTKLGLGSENFAFKAPIILPATELLVQRMVEERHRILLHAGTQTLMTNLRETFWIIGIRKLVKRVVSSCVRCKRFKAKHCQTTPANLPKGRIEATVAFEVCGADLAGPLVLKTGSKAWIVLFTCATYRAVHLEIVESLSTSEFIMALRRFIARRGRVACIYSDNGTNFRGLDNALGTLDWNEILRFSTIMRIQWRFLPPSAPWWGGFYERLIGVVKPILQRVLGKASVSLVELQTLLCDCEAVINRRPLTYVSNQMDELMPLTPATFIQSIPVSEVTDLDMVDGRGLNSRTVYCQKLREDFRQRFRSEYLGALVQRGKQSPSYQLQVGDVVLIETEGKRTNWPLALVEELYPGADGCSRVAKVRTSAGHKVRPLQRLFPLEVRWLELPQEQQETDEPLGPSSTDSQQPAVLTNDEIKTRSGRVVKLPSRYFD